jgi:DNA polymerase III epsilon subunit-like protein
MKTSRSSQLHLSMSASQMTEEQEAIIQTKLKAGECAAINAYAGTGKTTTLQAYAETNSDMRILYVCFNRETALQAKKRFPKNTECSTIHSLAYRQFGWSYRHKLGSPRAMDVIRELGLKSPDVAVCALSTVERFHYSVASEIDETHLPLGWAACRLPQTVLIDAARRVWRLMQDMDSPIPMSHDGYLKLWAMSAPILQSYQMIFLDEAQDTNPVTLQIILSQREASRCSLVFVGDKHQSIYGWRHAIDAMETIEEITDYHLPLTTSFRFRDNIAEDASFFLNHVKDDLVQLRGKGPTKKKVGNLVTIGRTNAGILETAINLAECGEKVHFAGTSQRDNWDPYIPYDLQTILDIHALQCGKKEGIKSPYIRSFQSFSQIMEHVTADQELAKQVKIVDMYGDLLPQKIELVRRFSSSAKESVMSLSTAHRSKGLEWQKVILQNDYREITNVSATIKDDPDILGEMNLIYVAMTRASEAIEHHDDLKGWLDGIKGINKKTDHEITLTTKHHKNMNESEWIIIDTETDGLSEPIHVVEIAAQRMKGWDPVGEKFRILINHGIRIPPEATAVHGYTTEFLRLHGEDPIVAYSRFKDFVQGLPLVAHNLSYDWNRALFPESQRLGVYPIGQRGFCTLMLSRRLIDECKSYKLDVLRSTFGISSADAHRAFGDVSTLVDLFSQVFKPRLIAAGLQSFDEISDFSKRNPVAKCLCQVKAQPQKNKKTDPQKCADSWYYVNLQKESHGPLTAVEIMQRMENKSCWIWQQGFSEWISSVDCEEFQKYARSLPTPTKSVPHRRIFTTSAVTQELIGVCRGIIADGKITTAEVNFLTEWLQSAGVITEWPLTEIAQTVEKITADGRVTKEEKQELLALLQELCS